MLACVKVTSRCFPQNLGTLMCLWHEMLFFAFGFTTFLISNVFTLSEQYAVLLLLFKEESLGRGRGIIQSALKTSWLLLSVPILMQLHPNLVYKAESVVGEFESEL